MARGHAFWVILIGAVPTAFRADDRETLVPTLHQLQRTQADVTLRWFDRGRLWDSPSEARDSLQVQRRRPDGRGREWRPGGTHQDPRDKYKITRDQKRARFKQNLGRPAKPLNWKPASSETDRPAPETRAKEPRPINWKPAGSSPSPRPDFRRTRPPGVPAKKGPINWKPAGASRDNSSRGSGSESSKSESPKSTSRAPINWKPASERSDAGARGRAPARGWKPAPGGKPGDSANRGWKPKPKGTSTKAAVNWKPAPPGGGRPREDRPDNRRASPPRGPDSKNRSRPKGRR